MAQPTGWTLDLAAGATVARDTTVVFSGTSSLKYSNPDNASNGGWHGMATNDPILGAFCVPFRAGLTYHLRPASRCTLSGLQYRIRIEHNVAGTLVSEKRFTYKAATTWQPDVFTFTVPAGAEQYSKVTVEFNRSANPASVDFWFDGLHHLEMEEVQFFDAGDSAASITVDWAKGPTQRIRLSAATPTILFVNGRPGATYTLLATQDGTGSRVVGTWDPSILWPAATDPPTLTTTADRTDILTFECSAPTVSQLVYFGRLTASNYSLNDVKAATGSVAVTSAQTVGTTIAVTGLGFQPKVVLIFSSGRSGASDAAGNADARTMIGAATGSAERRCMGTFQAHNVATTGSGAFIRDDAVAVEIDATFAVTGLLDLQSMDADGFTLIIDDQFAADHRFFFLALGGQTLKAKVGQWNTPTVTGNQAVTGVGFKPTGLLTFKSSKATINTGSGQGSIGIGLVSSTAARFAWTGGCTNGQTTPNGQSYGYTGEMLGFCLSIPPMDIRQRSDLVTFDADGFTHNALEAPGSAHIAFYVALAGCRVGVTNVATRTDTTGDITATVLPVSPRALLFLSHAKATSTQDTLQNDNELSLGVAAVPSVGGAPTQVAACVTDKWFAGAANSVIGTAHAFNACYVNMDQAGALEGRMQVLSVEPNGFTCRMDDADPGAARVGVMAIGV